MSLPRRSPEPLWLGSGRRWLAICAVGRPPRSRSCGRRSPGSRATDFGEPGLHFSFRPRPCRSGTITITTGRTQNGRMTWRSCEMPLGDAQRTWFPEMIVRLRAEWHAGMSLPALISLRDELDEMLHRIRAGRKIGTPTITCSKCGLTGPAAEPHVSVRALILALARFEIASRDRARALEREWAAYRKQYQLDVAGKASAGGPEDCPH